MSWRTHIARSSRTAFPGERWVRWTFALLMVLAAVLRFWDLPSIPYTHDEISALVRIYPTLGETIQRGVIELDTHPPGVQVFEWAWTKVFGMEEGAVKVPFILMALAALFLLFRFAQAWTSSSVALVLTALLATLQYTVMYAQIARPYAVGFFTTALLADQLTRYLAFGHRRALIGIGLAAVLSAYTHHFALLLAALMVVTGFLLVRKEQRRSYLVMALVAVLLYLPNVPIFLGQLAQGGLGGWLAKPDRHWLPNYAWWIAHCSTALATALVLLVLGALVYRQRNGGTSGPIRWVLVVWGLTPLLIGLAYSVWRAPVIQYSVVLFSFPYLLLALLMGLKELDRRVTMALCAVLSILAVHTLITDRHHYDLFYRSKYEAMVRDGQALLAAEGPDKATVVLDAPDEVVRFYMRLWNIAPAAFPYVQLRGQEPPMKVDSLLRALQGRAMLYGQSNGAPNENIARVQSHFPVLVAREDLFEGQVFRFEKGRSRSALNDRRIMARAEPGSRSAALWDIHDDLPADSLGAWDLTGREFGIAVTLQLDTLMQDAQDQFEILAEVSGYDATTDVGVVVDLGVGDSSVFYRTGELRDLRPVDGLATLAVAVRRADTRAQGPITLRTYLYNRNKGPLHVRSFTVTRREANPVQYGMFEPIRTLGRFAQ